MYRSMDSHIVISYTSKHKFLFNTYLYIQQTFTLPECISNRGHADYNMKVGLHTLHQQLEYGLISRSHTFFQSQW
jgi:hypothetical protein